MHSFKLGNIEEIGEALKNVHPHNFNLWEEHHSYLDLLLAYQIIKPMHDLKEMDYKLILQLLGTRVIVTLDACLEAWSQNYKEGALSPEENEAQQRLLIAHYLMLNMTCDLSKLKFSKNESNVMTELANRSKRVFGKIKSK